MLYLYWSIYLSEEDWQLAQKKRQTMGKKFEKIHHPERENTLSDILRCPICGAGMYGNVNRKKDGTLYKDNYYYQFYDKINSVERN